jgi:hypothetical protein
MYAGPVTGGQCSAAATLPGHASPPPGLVVVEEFVREISLKRWEQARPQLAAPLARRVEPDSLRRLLEAPEQRVGRAWT